MNELSELPLFPLDLVLFPGSYVPLYIFEERYKALIGKCIRDNSPFGINLVSDEKMCTVGCSAVVISHKVETPDGEMIIFAEGKRRFAVSEFETGKEGYLIAKVSYLNDHVTSYDVEELRKIVVLYNELMDLIYKFSAGKIELKDGVWNKKDISPSFDMVQMCVLSKLKKQKLLEMDYEFQRLEIIKEHLEQVLPKLRGNAWVNELLKGNGHAH